MLYLSDTKLAEQLSASQQQVDHWPEIYIHPVPGRLYPTVAQEDVQIISLFNYLIDHIHKACLTLGLEHSERLQIKAAITGTIGRIRRLLNAACEQELIT